MYTCVQEGHHHQQGGDEVDGLCPDHLLAHSAGPLLELLNAVVPVIPVSVWTSKVYVLQSMDNFVGYVRFFLKVSGKASFHHKYCYELKNG